MEQDWEDRLRSTQVTEVELRSALEEARRKYETAKSVFRIASEEAYSIGLNSVDGSHALFKATQEYNFALKHYGDALRRFTEIILYRREPRKGNPD
jgi:hypothetical protein